MRTKSTRKDVGGGGQQQQPLPEVRASKVLVKSKDAGCRSRRARRTWVLPVLRMLALAASMLCLTPTGGMVTGMSKMDAWGGGSENELQREDRWSHGEQRQEYVVFVGVPEESAVLPLKALAQEMMARGYRASLALPQGFQAWVEDIPGLSFLSLKPAATTTATSNATETPIHGAPIAPSAPPPPPQHQHQQQASSSFGHPCPARPHPHGRRTPCKGKGLGDAWGGGVGGGWGAGLGIWRGLKGSLVGAREFLGHLRAYLGCYRREEAVMYAPLLEALRRDPPALVVADRRASAAFRACSKLGLRCVVNSAGLLGDLDRPPSSIPAPYTGFPMEGQTIAQRVHSSLIRLVLALSRMQAARDAENLEMRWSDETPVFSSDDSSGSHQHYRQHQHHHHHEHHHGGYRSSPVMALGNSCFGSLEYPRELPARVHMVGPLWMTDPDSNNGQGLNANGAMLSSGQGQSGSAHTPSTSSSSSSSSRKKGRGGGDSDGAGSAAAAEVGEKEMTGGDRVLQDVWSWLEPENVEEGEAAPVVVVQLGYGGGWAWGVSPEAGVGGTGDGSNGARLSWKAFREETVSQLSAVGCRTLWLDNGPHSDHNYDDGDHDDQHHGRTAEAPHTCAAVSASACIDTDGISGDGSAHTERSAENSPEVSPKARHRKKISPPSPVPPTDTSTAREEQNMSPRKSAGGGVDGDTRATKTGADEEEESSADGRRAVMVLDVREEGFIGAEGMTGSADWLLRVMSHRLVTVLVTDGDVRSLQTALWHGKPSVVLPTSPDQREAAARLAHRGAGVTCAPPCNATSLTAAIIDAHGMDRRRGALRSSAALRETGGVSRAGDLLENELRTHKAATAARIGCPYGVPSLWEDAPAWCYGGKDRREERSSSFSEQFPAGEEEDEEEPISVPEGLSWFPEGLSWFPDDPDWVWTEMSWLQRHLVDVYAVYGALVMGVGLLMKLTWNLVWSLCDITTAPPIPRGSLGSMDHLRSPSPSPAKDKCAAAAAAAAGGSNGGGSSKLARGGAGKWGSGTGGVGGGGGKHGRGGGSGKHSHGGGSGNVNISSAAIVHGEGTPPLSGGKYSKRMMAITNGNGHS